MPHPNAGPDANVRFDMKWVRDSLTGCHIWTAGLSGAGYGKFYPRRQAPMGAHVFAYERKYGAVPAGLVLDHVVCSTRRCCNPDHVRPTTTASNTLRSPIAPAAINARKTHCKRGHEFTPENTYHSPSTKGKRVCRECHHARLARVRERARRENRPRA